MAPYSLRIRRGAARALATGLPEKIATAVYEFMTGPLLDDPRRVGKPLRPPFAPVYAARRGSWRILYLIDDQSRTVTVAAIQHRADAYGT